MIDKILVFKNSKFESSQFELIKVFKGKYRRFYI